MNEINFFDPLQVVVFQIIFDYLLTVYKCK